MGAAAMEAALAMLAAVVAAAVVHQAALAGEERVAGAGVVGIRQGQERGAVAALAVAAAIPMIIRVVTGGLLAMEGTVEWVGGLAARARGELLVTVGGGRMGSLVPTGKMASGPCRR